MDDVFSELDKKRRGALLELIKGEQTIITTTDPDHASEEFIKRADLYKVVDRGVKKLTN